MKPPLESYLQDWIWENRDRLSDPNPNGDAEESDEIPVFEGIEIFAREYVLPSGVADFLAVNYNWSSKQPLPTLLVIETKRDALNLKALAQTLRYMRDIQVIWKFAIAGQLDLSMFGDEFACYPRVEGFMVGYSIDRDTLIAAHAANVQTITYKLTDNDYEFSPEFPFGHHATQYLSYHDSPLGDHIRNLHNEYAQQTMKGMLGWQSKDWKELPLAKSINDYWKYYLNSDWEL